MSINLEWVGLACFRIWAPGGAVVATDPYTPSAIGLSKATEVELQIQADTVICSSMTDVAHSYVPLIEGDPTVINALEVAQNSLEVAIDGTNIVTVEGAESPDHPEGPDDNALYSFKIGGLWFLHMGDVGFGLTPEQLAPFVNHCDVLLALTGEKLTLRLEELDEMIDFLKPKWIIPMHYGLDPINGFAPNIMTKVDTFLNHRSDDPVIHVRHHTIEFPINAPVPEKPTIIVLDPSGYDPNEGLGYKRKDM